MFETRSGEGLLVEWVERAAAEAFPAHRSLRCTAPKQACPRSRSRRASARRRRRRPRATAIRRTGTCPGKSRTLPLSQRAGRGAALVSRPRDGHQPAEYLRGTVRPVRHSRCASRTRCNLPSGKYEIPLVIFDRDARADGQLSYPVSADPERPWVPEVFGELHLVNGKIVAVSRGRAAQVSLAHPECARTAASIACRCPTGVDVSSDRHRSGTCCRRRSRVKHVLLAPAERADLVVDFARSSRRAHRC